MMGSALGQMITCDRCKKNIVFLRWTKDVGLSNYSGPGTRSVYEDLPRTWMRDNGFGYLCPSCAKEFVTFLKQFLGEEKYESLAPVWRIEEEEGNGDTDE